MVQTDDSDEDCDSYILQKRLKYLDLILLHYWKRFYNEYLNQLREKHCYVNGKYYANKLVVNDVVLIKDGGKIKRNTWKQGVVQELIKGSDGNIRGAVVRTNVNGKSSIINRPVQNLIPLEVARSSSSDLSATRHKIKNSINKSVNIDDTIEGINLTNNNASVSCERPRRNAAVVGELQRRLCNQK